MVHLMRCPRVCLLIPIGGKGVQEATQDQEEQAVDNYPWVLTTCPDDYDKAFVCGLDVEQAVSNIPVEPKEILNLPPGAWAKKGQVDCSLQERSQQSEGHQNQKRHHPAAGRESAKRMPPERRSLRPATHDGAFHHQTR